MIARRPDFQDIPDRVWQAQRALASSACRYRVFEYMIAQIEGPQEVRDELTYTWLDHNPGTPNCLPPRKQKPAHDQ